MAQLFSLGIIHDMKIRRIILVTVGCLFAAGIFSVFCGCSSIKQWTFAYKVPMSYYKIVSVGVPVVEGRQVVVPLVLSDAGMNSAESLYRVRAHVSGSEIDITALTTLEGDGKEQFVLSGVSPGDYTVFYQDPDGTRHKLSQITIPKP